MAGKLGSVTEDLQQGGRDEAVDIGSLADVVAHGQALRSELVREARRDHACTGAEPFLRRLDLTETAADNKSTML